MNTARPDLGEQTLLAEESGVDHHAPLSDLHAMLAKVERQHHALFINRLANDPSIYPWVRGWIVGKIDLTAAAANPANVVLAGEFGATIWMMHQPGLFEVHSFALPAGRGAWMLSFFRACEHIMFTRSNAVELLTRIPKGNIAARALARALGWTFEFRNEKGWIKDLDPIPADIYGLRLQDWARTAPGLEERGHWFHERLEEEFKRHGKTEAPHPDDVTHDRYVGLCMEMMLSGMPDKGVVFYNRWAALSDYQQIAIAGYDPLLVEIVSAQIIVRPDRGDFWCPMVR